MSDVPTRVALTFDAEAGEDIPDHNVGPEGWADILDLLSIHGIRSTFFLQGDWVARFPDLARRTRDAGHLLGNHTLNHRDLGAHPEHLVDQVETSRLVIQAVLNVELRPWFRLPYFSGNRDREINRQLRELGWHHVDRNCEARDWDPLTSTPQHVAANILGDVRCNGSAPLVMLFHTWPRPTAEGVSLVIDELRGRNTEFVTVADLTDVERASICLPGATSREDPDDGTP
jgi:peptidoglycan-N-acetylglucosamine deacetylase